MAPLSKPVNTSEWMPPQQDTPPDMGLAQIDALDEADIMAALTTLFHSQR